MTREIQERKGSALKPSLKGKNWNGVTVGKTVKGSSKFSAKEVKMATGIAKQKHDNMTDAVERIEKIAKGLSDHPGVARALKMYNEDSNMYYHEEFGYGEVLESNDESYTVLFPHGVEILEKSSCGTKKEDNTNDQSDDGEGMDDVQPNALKKKFKNRKDKDIDNDGDEDESDEYLHNRRKAVSKAVAKEDVEVDNEEEQLDENFSKDDIAEQDAQVNQTIARAKSFLTRMWENSAASANAKRTANAVEAEPQLTVHDKDSVTGKAKKYHDDNTVDRKDDEEQSHDDALKASRAVKSQASSRNSSDNLKK